MAFKNDLILNATKQISFIVVYGEKIHNFTRINIRIRVTTEVLLTWRQCLSMSLHQIAQENVVGMPRIVIYNHGKI